ncbi:hypothetical protein HDU84_005349 [Entophlyctis sp. JEL0112]|nr:hypothetical protein HDU84_005349 [Entophlyctis sp. JEL0112]
MESRESKNDVPASTTAELILRTQTYARFYVFVRAIACGSISAGVNYGIAYAMYAGADKPMPHAYMFPSTILGDYVVTALVQAIIVWFATAVGVFGDLRVGLVRANLISAKCVEDIKKMISNNECDAFNVSACCVAMALPHPSKLDLLRPSISRPVFSAAMALNLRYAGYSAIISLIAFIPPAIAATYGTLGLAYYGRQDAIFAKAAFSGIMGFTSSVVISLMVLVSAQVWSSSDVNAEVAEA